MKNKIKFPVFFLLLAVMAGKVSWAASPYATTAGAGLFYVTDQTVSVWEWDEASQSVVETGQVHHADEWVVQGPDQDWSGPASMNPGIVQYQNFLGPADRYTSGWGGLAAGGALVLGFDTPFLDGEGDDFIVEGFGLGFNIPFSMEMGTVSIYVADESYSPVVNGPDPHTGLVTIQGDETKWIKLSGWTGWNDDKTQWTGNPDFNYDSGVGEYGWILKGDLADVSVSSARYIKIELGDGNHHVKSNGAVVTHGRALFIDSTKTVYHAPTANAGEDRLVNVNVEVTLNASDSEDIDENDAVLFSWRQTGGDPVDLEDISSPMPKFTPETTGTLTFEVSVSDGTFTSTDTVTVHVTEPGANQSPFASAGEDLFVNEGDSVYLDGSKSSDPDGDMLTYCWEQTGGQPVTLSDPSLPNPSFTAVNTPIKLTFTLTVTDPGGLPDTDSVEISVNRLPSADAGKTAEDITESLLATLDGSGSFDPDGDELSFIWRQTKGPDVVLSDAIAIKPTFIVPESPGETLGFQLTVTDDKGLSRSDYVEMKIRKLYIIDSESYATSAKSQMGSTSWNLGTLDKGKAALGRPDFASGGGDCSGWDNTTGEIILMFDVPIADGNGDDLTIHHFGNDSSTVYLSIDGEKWTLMGTLEQGPEEEGKTLSTSYDFEDYPELKESRVTSIQYLKIVKSRQDGKRFIDGATGHHSALTGIYGTFVVESDGSVDWMYKLYDSGRNALGKPDYDDSSPGIGNCSGWMVNSGRIVIGFDQPFVNREGDDLTIYHFGQGVTDTDIRLGETAGATTVDVSADGTEWISLGDLPPGKNQGTYLSVDAFDFADYPRLSEKNNTGVALMDAGFQYVRINKNGNGYTSGKFIDAVEGNFGFPGKGNIAGKDMTVSEGSTVILGKKNTGEDSGDSAEYQWEQIDNGAVRVTLSSETVPNPSFIAPQVAGDSVTLLFRLVKTDPSEEGVSMNDVSVVVTENNITEFASADFTFENDLAGTAMGLTEQAGKLVYQEVLDVDYKFASGYISDMENRPKNMSYGLLKTEVRLDSESRAVFTVHLSEPVPEGYAWYKYSNEKGWTDFDRQLISENTGDGAVLSRDRKTVTVYISDNGEFDDSDEEGLVRDASGMAMPGTWHDDIDSSGGGCFIDTTLTDL